MSPARFHVPASVERVSGVACGDSAARSSSDCPLSNSLVPGALRCVSARPRNSEHPEVAKVVAAIEEPDHLAPVVLLLLRQAGLVEGEDEGRLEPTRGGGRRDRSTASGQLPIRFVLDDPEEHPGLRSYRSQSIPEPFSRRVHDLGVTRGEGHLRAASWTNVAKLLPLGRFLEALGRKEAAESILVVTGQDVHRRKPRRLVVP